MSAAALEWSYNPWRDRPGRAALALVAALVCCLLVLALNLGGLATLLLCVACVTSLALAFLPVRCRLDEQGVVRRSGWLAERRRWDDLRRAVRTPEGVWLSPFRERHWLDAYRTLFLPLPVRSRPLADEVDRMLIRHGL